MKYFKTVILFLLCSSLYATPVRIIGMGSLDLIIEDESNRINLFDYGKNVAGLYGDENGSSIETYITYGNIKSSDSSGTRDPEISYWGVPLPADIFEPPQDIKIKVNFLSSSMLGIPVGANVTYRMEGGFAFNCSGAFSSTRAKNDSSSREDNVSLPIGRVIVSRNFGMYAAGISGSYSKIRLTNNRNDNETYGILKGLDASVAAHLSPMSEIGIRGGFAIPEGGRKYWGEENSFKGKALSVGVQAINRVPGLYKFGTRINFLNANLDGRVTPGVISGYTGEMSGTDFDFGSRLLIASFLFPIKLGANLDYRKLHPVYKDDEGTTQFDNSLTMINTGLGVSYAMPLLTPGLQYNLYNAASTDNLDDEKTNSSFWDIRFGGEFNLTLITLRAGFIIAKDDPDKDREDDEYESRSITLGAGLQLPLQPFKFEVAYINKETKPTDNPTEQKEVNNSIYTAFKMKF